MRSGISEVRTEASAIGAPESDTPIVAKAFGDLDCLTEYAEVDTPRLVFFSDRQGASCDGIPIIRLITVQRDRPDCGNQLIRLAEMGLAPNRAAPGGNLPIAMKNQGSGGSIPIIDIAVRWFASSCRVKNSINLTRSPGTLCAKPGWTVAATPLVLAPPSSDSFLSPSKSLIICSVFIRSGMNRCWLS